MNKMRHALALMFLVSLRLGAPPASAAADRVESDTFKFTWLGVPIGMVTLHYGSFEDSKRTFGRKPAALTATRVRTLDRHSQLLVDTEYVDRKSMEALRLGSLEGRTNGLVRWLKRYEGVYKTTLTPGGSRYQVIAMDQGVPEARDIWFGAKHSDIPQVLDFRDRTSADPLQPLIGLDEGSVDPVRLMALILKDIESRNGCPPKPEAFHVFDGKRRYEARLSNPNWVDTSLRTEQAGSSASLEVPNEQDTSSIGSVMTSIGGLSASGREAGAASRHGARSAFNRDSREGRAGDQDRYQSKSTGIGTSVAHESDEVMNRARPSSVPNTVECQLALFARGTPEDLRGDSKLSEINASGKLMPAGQTVHSSIALQEQDGVSDGIAPQVKVAMHPMSMDFTDSRYLALETENEDGQQSLDFTTQRRLFWPFNRKDLTVEFSVSLNVAGARFRSFLIRAPVGQIKGRLTIKE